MSITTNTTNETEKQNSEKRLPVTDSCHAKLSELKGKLRKTFSELIEDILIPAYEREQLEREIEI